jgi:PAS domain S-box-containing protein
MSLSRFRRLADAGRTSAALLTTLLILIPGARAADAASVTGHVTDPDGRAVAGARIVLTTDIGTTVESTTDGILVVDTQGRIRSFNRKFVELWGLPDDVLASRDDERALTEIKKRLAAEKDLEIRETSVTTQTTGEDNGTQLFAGLNAAAVGKAVGGALLLFGGAGLLPVLGWALYRFKPPYAIWPMLSWAFLGIALAYFFEIGVRLERNVQISILARNLAQSDAKLSCLDSQHASKFKSEVGITEREVSMSLCTASWAVRIPSLVMQR